MANAGDSRLNAEGHGHNDHASLLAFLRPRNRSVPRKLMYVVLAAIALFLLAAGSVKTHLVQARVPQLDTSEWLQALQSWYTGKPNGGFRKAVVLASYEKQDVRWLRWLDSDLTSGYVDWSSVTFYGSLINLSWEMYRYVSDAPASAHSPDVLTVQNPDGREALSYLTFIIDHYADLPDITVFIHGHKRAWHQPALIYDRLSALNLTAVENEGYVSLSCHGGGCDEKTKFYFDGSHPDDHRRGTRIKDFWDEMMVPHGFGDLPPVIGRQCCAQFAVHKSAILRHDHKFWRNMREPFLVGPKHKRPSWLGPLESGHKIGLIYEMLWHILFGKDAVHCPSYETCENVHFQGLIHCERRIAGWDDKDGWEEMKCTNDLRKEIDVA